MQPSAVEAAALAVEAALLLPCYSSAEQRVLRCGAVNAAKVTLKVQENHPTETSRRVIRVRITA